MFVLRIICYLCIAEDLAAVMLLLVERCGKTDLVSKLFYFDLCLITEQRSRFQVGIFACLMRLRGSILVRHGTGHGVGHFLNVHEGPHGIGTRISECFAVADHLFCSSIRGSSQQRASEARHDRFQRTRLLR